MLSVDERGQQWTNWMRPFFPSSSNATGSWNTSMWHGVVIQSLLLMLWLSMTARTMSFTTSSIISLLLKRASIGNVVSIVKFEQVRTIYKLLCFQRIHKMACISVHVHVGQTRLMWCSVTTWLLFHIDRIFQMWLRLVSCPFGGRGNGGLCRFPVMSMPMLIWLSNRLRMGESPATVFVFIKIGLQWKRLDVQRRGSGSNQDLRYGASLGGSQCNTSKMKVRQVWLMSHKSETTQKAQMT